MAICEQSSSLVVAMRRLDVENSEGSTQIASLRGRLLCPTLSLTHLRTAGPQGSDLRAVGRSNVEVIPSTPSLPGADFENECGSTDFHVSSSALLTYGSGYGVC